MSSSARALLHARPVDPHFERAALLSCVVILLDLTITLPATTHPVVLLSLALLLAVLARIRAWRRPAFWFASAALSFAFLLGAWWTTDDHRFLVAYWLLALGLASLEDSPAESLARHARILLGLVFLFATAWKVLSPDYRNGALFHYLLLVDPRISRVATFAGTLEPATVSENFGRVQQLQADAGTAVALTDAPGVGMLAAALAIAIVAFEGALAAAFLLPAQRVPWWVRDGLLLAFLVGTYLLAPVLLFGVLLAAMGIAQAVHPHARTGYLVAAIWVFAGTILYWIR